MSITNVIYEAAIVTEQERFNRGYEAVTTMTSAIIQTPQTRANQIRDHNRLLQLQRLTRYSVETIKAITAIIYLQRQCLALPNVGLTG